MKLDFNSKPGLPLAIFTFFLSAHLFAQNAIVGTGFSTRERVRLRRNALRQRRKDVVENFRERASSDGHGYNSRVNGPITRVSVL